MAVALGNYLGNRPNAGEKGGAPFRRVGLLQVRSVTYTLRSNHYLKSEQRADNFAPKLSTSVVLQTSV